MALVWAIDLVVQFVKILGGRHRVAAVVRLAAWLALIALVAAGVVLLLWGIKALYDYLATLPPTSQEAAR
ncbi:hypothetical protein MTP03_47270 [Tsukamurella sp. PLM1]|nr:hypothetical protein MTP03_47270 [Tsukamurella sp. PLM1]